MRLIDADLLIQDTIQEYARSKQYRDAVTRMVNKAPTIEPKRGEWIGTRIGHYPGYECSLCHYGVQPWNTTNFCPNCGARMKGKDNE